MVKFAQLPKYEVYKPSKIEFSASIPESWAEVPIRSIFNERNEKNTGPKTDFILSVTRDRGVIPYDEKGAIGNNKSEDIERYKIVYKNDLVINKMNVVIGSLGLSRYYGALSQVYIVLNPKSVNFSIRYYSYIFNNEPFYKSLIRYCKGIMELRESLDKDQFKKLYLPLPMIEEQELISNFLDQKIAQIDAAIAIKEQQIELLKERKQIIIQQAVTQGLDPNVPMKDSGVDWIGKIPAHWKVKKIKYLAKIFRGKFTHRPRNDPAFYDGNYPFFQTGDVARAGKFLSDYKQTLNEKGLKVSTLIPRGTVVITIAANIGDVSILDIDACFPDSVVGFQPNNGLNRDYLYYALGNMKQQFIDSSIKNTQMNLNVDRIGANYICEPPENEQLKIVTLIEEQDHEINRALDLQKQQIHKLKEYKTTLINSAVTGKIKITPEMLQS